MKAAFILAAAALVASPLIFAEVKTTCEEYVKELENVKPSKLEEPARSQVKEHIEKARDAHKSGNTQACTVNATKALQKLRAPGQRESDDNQTAQ
ncbi:hypothetical protein [Marinobacter salicampi]|uniref:hypothetical protein n=1 Tax=Marinobacter salicampi TaxID=435907 RepID=UPI00140949E4|nr:hypothetical protein [Marinobacter salicampi]